MYFVSVYWKVCRCEDGARTLKLAHSKWWVLNEANLSENSLEYSSSYLCWWILLIILKMIKIFQKFQISRFFDFFWGHIPWNIVIKPAPFGRSPDERGWCWTSLQLSKSWECLLSPALQLGCTWLLNKWEGRNWNWCAEVWLSRAPAGWAPLFLGPPSLGLCPPSLFPAALFSSTTFLLDLREWPWTLTSPDGQLHLAFLVLLPIDTDTDTCCVLG